VLHVTKQQGEILRLASQGLTDKEVAKLLALSVSTIRTHLYRFYRANSVRNKAEAVTAWNAYMGVRQHSR
jgi:DNA-binding CsgD family transcriptional regulator